MREHEGRRRVHALQWGLIPFWAKDPTIGRKLINARLDSVATKPAFREAWQRRRCLIPASGFYEWSEPRGGRKRPHFIRPVGEPLFALAGLWERWRTPTGEKLDTCVIVTTDANAQLVGREVKLLRLIRIVPPFDRRTNAGNSRNVPR